MLGRRGRFDGRRILELGPLEGGHTYVLEKLGANVLAIESNKDAYLKCLIAKEITAPRTARFMLGDFVEYMCTTRERFDVVFASGVLYHMSDPVKAIESIARVSDACFVWTHVYDEATYKGPERQRLVRDDGLIYYSLDYGHSMGGSRFWGGKRGVASWMTAGDMHEAFSRAGFNKKQMVKMETDSEAVICFVAWRE